MTTLRDKRSIHRAEPAKAIFHHRALILRYGVVQQTAQIAAARDLALFVRQTGCGGNFFHCDGNGARLAIIDGVANGHPYPGRGLFRAFLFLRRCLVVTRWLRSMNRR